MAPHEPDGSRQHRRLVWTLAVVVALMSGFGYALVPLYNVVCKLTGLNGKTGGINKRAVAAIKVDKQRWVKVEFLADVNQEMPWTFRPVTETMRVHPGALVGASYYVKNRTDEVMTGQAVDSIIPNSAAPYFKKLQCFCFTRHTLQPHQAQTLDVRYIVMPNLPESVHTIYLSYTFFKVSARAAPGVGAGISPGRAAGNG